MPVEANSVTIAAPIGGASPSLIIYITNTGAERTLVVATYGTIVEVVLVN